MYSEGELLPLSGLQHLPFCERRWALVHLEQQWEENVFTAEGAVLHKKAHSGAIESRPGALIRRTLPLHCY
jgi:CRISPR-associated exonuclease Cas4